MAGEVGGEVEGEVDARDLLVGPLVGLPLGAGVALPLRVWLVRGDTFRWKLEGALSDSLYLRSVLGVLAKRFWRFPRVVPCSARSPDPARARRGPRAAPGGRRRAVRGN